MKQLNLKTEIHNLTESDIDQLINILGYRCRIKTIKRIRSVLTYPTGLKIVGLFDRMIKENGKWKYVSGQDYDSEIKLFRELLIK